MSVPTLPSNWNYEPLKFHSSFSKGLSIQKSDLTDEGVAVISYGQIHAKSNSGVHLTDDLIRYVPRKLTLHGTTAKLRCGDLIYADTSEDVRGIGNAVFIDNSNEIFAGYHTLICHPDGTTLLGHYLAFLSQSDWWRAQLRSIAMGVKVFSITQSLMSRVWVPLPPINEQKKIVAELSLICNAIDESIQSIENQISVLERYRASVIHEAVTKGLGFNAPMKPSGIDWIGDIPEKWQLKRIKFMFDTFSGATPESSNWDLYDGGINWIQSGDLYTQHVITETGRTVSNKALSEVSALKIYKAPFVVIAMYGASVGNVSISKIDACTNQACCVMLPKEETTTQYLFYALMDSQIFLKYKALGGTQPNISQVIIRNHKIPVPSKDEQVAIVNYLDTQTAVIDSILDIKRKQIDILKRRRQSLIYEYVTGKRCVKKEM